METSSLRNPETSQAQKRASAPETKKRRRHRNLET